MGLSLLLQKFQNIIQHVCAHQEYTQEREYLHHRSVQDGQNEFFAVEQVRCLEMTKKLLLDVPSGGTRYRCIFGTFSHVNDRRFLANRPSAFEKNVYLDCARSIYPKISGNILIITYTEQFYYYQFLNNNCT